MQGEPLVWLHIPIKKIAKKSGEKCEKLLLHLFTISRQ